MREGNIGGKDCRNISYSLMDMHVFRCLCFDYSCYNILINLAEEKSWLRSRGKCFGSKWCSPCLVTYPLSQGEQSHHVSWTGPLAPWSLGLERTISVIASEYNIINTVSCSGKPRVETIRNLNLFHIYDVTNDFWYIICSDLKLGFKQKYM